MCKAQGKTGVFRFLREAKTRRFSGRYAMTYRYVSNVSNSACAILLFLRKPEFVRGFNYCGVFCATARLGYLA
jgi:hypothetical protein